jgi:alpha-1,3-glucan synthase
MVRSNDDANGTAYEHDLISNQFRNGGDVKGLVDSLDYLQGMGIKVRDSLLITREESC